MRYVQAKGEAEIGHEDKIPRQRRVCGEEVEVEGKSAFWARKLYRQRIFPGNPAATAPSLQCLFTSSSPTAPQYSTSNHPQKCFDTEAIAFHYFLLLFSPHSRKLE